MAGAISTRIGVRFRAGVVYVSFQESPLRQALSAMCSFFSLRNPHSHPINQNAAVVLQEAMKVQEMLGPGQLIVIGIAEPGAPAGVVKLTQQRATFGFLPHWAKPDMNSQRNARGETVAEKPYFRDAFARTRCLVPADGWYEWLHAGGKKTRYLVRKMDDAGFYFAGLYSIRKQPDGAEDWTFCIITTEASEDLRWLHERNPVVVPEDSWTAWLSNETKAADLKALLTAAPAGTFQVEEAPGKKR